MATKKTPTKPATKKNGAPRRNSLVGKIAAMMQRPKGVTREEALKVTEWKSVSMQQMAELAGLKLAIDKTERPFTYHAK